MNTSTFKLVSNCQLLVIEVKNIANHPVLPDIYLAGAGVCLCFAFEKTIIFS